MTSDLLPNPAGTLDDLIILRRDALAAGYSEHEIVRLCRAKVWTRIRHGAYVPTDVWATLSPAERHRLVTRAVLRQANVGMVISHGSAAIEHGGPTYGLDLAATHVTRRDARAGRIAAGVHQHQGKLLPQDVVAIDGLDVTSATRTALDLTTLLPTEAAVCQVVHLLRSGGTDREQLATGYASMERNPYTLRTDLALRLSDPLLESVGECRTFFMCWKYGVDRPVLQHEVRDESGLVVARLDFSWPKQRIWLEFDGRIKYTKLLQAGESTSDAVVREKTREDLVRRLTGWRCLRITWADLADPARLARDLRIELGDLR